MYFNVNVTQVVVITVLSKNLPVNMVDSLVSLRVLPIDRPDTNGRTMANRIRLRRLSIQYSAKNEVISSPGLEL